MKKIVIAIVIILILIILIAGSLLFVMNNSEPDTDDEMAGGDVGLDINFEETTIEPLTDSIEFFTVQNIVQGYLNTINLQSSSYYDDYGEEISDKAEIATNIYNLLSKQYIDANSITKDNIFNYIDKVNENLIFVPIEMNYLLLQNVTKYAVHGFCINWNNEYVKDLYFIVDIDNVNKTFSITPLRTEEYESVNDIKLDRIEVSISAKENNTVMLQTITDQYLCQQYFLIQKRLMLARPEFSYNYLDDEYRNKRFGSLENYLKYVSENKAHILKMVVRSYDVERIGDTAQLMCKDQYGNYYIFNVEKVLDYKVLLDIYTVEQEESITAYKGYNRRQKIAYNVNKWVQMINNKDYTGAYNLLNETFRDNNWNSVEEFESFIKQNYSSYYEIEYTRYEESNENSIQTITLKDIDKKEENKNLTIIMRLKDNMDFEMSIAL